MKNELKELKRKLTALVLAGTLTSNAISVLTQEAKAVDDEVIEETIVLEEEDLSKYDLVNFHNLNGVYTLILNNKPVYVYLNNNLDNKYLSKGEALEIAKNNYKDKEFNIYSKVVESPSYLSIVESIKELDGDNQDKVLSPEEIDARIVDIFGINPEEFKYNSVYAISDIDVDGWTKIENRDDVDEMILVATSIDLGEFILQEVDLSSHYENMDGYAMIDIKNDGVEDVVYLGNNTFNSIINKEDAKTMMKATKGMKLYSKEVTQKGKKTTMYGLNTVNPQNGWREANINNVPDNKLVIGTTTLLMDAKYDISTKEVTSESIYIPKDENIMLMSDEMGVEAQNDVVMLSMQSLPKDAALEYAYKSFGGVQFCILTRNVTLDNGDIKSIYAFSTEMNVNGWEFAFDDNITASEEIFLSMTDALNYIDTYGKSAVPTLR